ncbi:hypothetical protein EWM64_g5447 [Hericium alpestre]|uniref:Enoyl reductase (ER) domain-containing protein n=1 Tax=Hericium alpestre TaxID=135208 RepID=A0A4Y9ZWY5_9AGAM|nr:hypothetical protein EWM64_g5447 [Hericium alpestre]
MTTAELPKTQNAWKVVRQGRPDKALVLKKDEPMPTKLKPGEVLVKVQAASLNPVGHKIMGLVPNFVAGRPLTPEHDFAGIVVDGNDTRWHRGEAVFGVIPLQLNLKSKYGALSEYTVAPADNLETRPEKISPVQASGIPTVGLTAWQALFEYLNIEEGQHIFIYGGGTSVGTYAIQLAKWKGVKVTVAASGKKEDFVKGLGADEFIDYTKQDVPTYLQKNPPAPKFHAIFDAYGLADPSLYTKSESYLAPGGIFASVGPQPHGFSGAFHVGKLLWCSFMPALLGGVRRRWSFVLCQINHEQLAQLADLIVQDKVKPIVDSVYAFEDALQAYDKIMKGDITGKVVVKVDPNVD